MRVTPQWVDPFSPSGVREATSKILTGINYRLFFESATRRNLLETYRELAELARKHPNDDDAWKTSIRRLVESGTPEDGRLRYWLIGLTKKTADNLGVKAGDYPSIFDQMMAEIAEFSRLEGKENREMALLALVRNGNAHNSRLSQIEDRQIAGSVYCSRRVNSNRPQGKK